MTELDQFESTFKSADKTPYKFESVDFDRILFVTDLDEEGTQQFVGQLKGSLKRLAANSEPEWDSISKDQFSGVANLLEEVDKRRPDLICTYRNLRIEASEFPHSLGVYVDVLTQVAPAPVLLLPHPKLPSGDQTHSFDGSSVMAITDHLTGDHHLVSVAARLTQPKGTLWLTHVEDEATFERYITTIGKIPEIDTDQARQTIQQQLLKEPHDYILSARKGLESHQLPIQVEESVTLGCRLADYRRLIKQHQIDLLVMNTKDEDQLAMHGTAYPLSIELHDLPLLLL